MVENHVATVKVTWGFGRSYICSNAILIEKHLAIVMIRTSIVGVFPISGRKVPAINTIFTAFFDVVAIYKVVVCNII